jgi:hypothetical protein
MLPAADYTEATDHERKEQVATPDENSQTEKDVTEKLRLLRGVGRACHVARSDFAVYLSGEDYADYPERKTADG